MTDTEKYAPGSYGCHEALHLAWMLHDSVCRYLIEHPAVEAKPEWTQLASAAAEALFQLYQAIGVEHLDRETDEAQPNGYVDWSKIHAEDTFERRFRLACEAVRTKGFGE